MAAEKGKNKKGMGKGKAEVKTKLPELLKSDDLTGQYKEDIVHLMMTLPEKYRQAYNKAWNVSYCTKRNMFLLRYVQNYH